MRIEGERGARMHPRFLAAVCREGGSFSEYEDTGGRAGSRNGLLMGLALAVPSGIHIA